LQQFRQMAIIMAVGVVVDTFVVRSLLVPSLVALTGRAGMWPGQRRVRDRARQVPPAPEFSDASR
jgi:putative drug exporter of the RND superfamily